MWVIGDVHGCNKTLQELIAKIGEPLENIIIAGDLVDRGPDSKGVIQFVKDNNIKAVQGNHEQMMYTDINGTTKYPGSWKINGGKETLSSYGRPTIESGEILMSHAEFLETLPLYLEFPELKNNADRYLVVSHASIGSTWRFRDKDHPKHNFFIEESRWNRNTPKDVNEIYNIFGHTPVDSPKIKSYYANIDTGCVFTGRDTYGVLSALHYPSMNVIQQRNIDYE